MPIIRNRGRARGVPLRWGECERSAERARKSGKASDRVSDPGWRSIFETEREVVRRRMHGWLRSRRGRAGGLDRLEQERLRRLRLNFRIGEVLVRLKALEVDQVRSILREQGFDLSCCRECDALIEGASEDGKSGSCPFCDGELRPPVFLDPVPADHSRSR